MRIFLTLLALIFSLQTWTKADDIRDFQIEGMSIGDSLLDFYSEKEIKSNIKLYDKEINITELTFLEIFLSKFKKINKIEFLFKFYINNFKYLK